MRFDDPNISLSVVAGIVGAILVFVIIVGLQAMFYSMETAELERKVFNQPNQELEQLRAGQLERLHSYGWVDQNQGTVHIPIGRAMEIVSEELATR